MALSTVIIYRCLADYIVRCFKSGVTGPGSEPAAGLMVGSKSAVAKNRRTATAATLTRIKRAKLSHYLYIIMDQ